MSASKDRQSGRSEQHRHRSRVWRRDEGTEFDRVAMFSDAVFAIALTLLALDLRIDHLQGPADDPASMLNALNDLTPKLVAYAVGFWLMARQWMVHHRFFGDLEAVNGSLISMNLAYLAFVALLPFPTSLIGEYESNPISAVAFSLNLAIIGLLGALMLGLAYRDGLTATAASAETVKWTIIDRVTPSVMFIATIPLAFIDPTIQLLSWLPISFVNAKLLSRARPASVAPLDEE